MKIRAETIRNFASLARTGESATTPELAAIFESHPVNVINRLKRYEAAGYLTSETIEELRTDKHGRDVTRKIYRWSPTDKLKDLVDLTDAQERQRKPVRMINSVFALGQL